MNRHSPPTSEFGSAEEAAAYDAWFRRKVAEALADPRPPVPHDQVMAEVRETIERAKRRKNEC
jgi:hypothetical protein